MSTPARVPTDPTGALSETHVPEPQFLVGEMTPAQKNLAQRHNSDGISNPATVAHLPRSSDLSVDRLLSDRAGAELKFRAASHGHPVGRSVVPWARERFRPGWLISVLLVLGLLLTWQVLVSMQHLEAWLLPGPLDVLAAFGKPEVRALILDNLTLTLTEALIGFVACVVIGVALAVAMFASRILRDALYPLVIATQAIPTIAIGAVLVVALGYGLAPKVVVVVLYAFFAITVNMYDSLQALDPELPATLRTLGASPWQILRTARLPAALPGFFTGARLAATYSISGAIYGEWVGSTGGLGYALQQAANQFQAATVMAIVVVMAALGVIAFALLALLERVCIPWARAVPGER